MKWMKLIAAMTLIMGLVVFLGCGDDDPAGLGDTADPELWEGDWLSADANVAPILVTLFNLDSVRVSFNENMTVSLMQHDTITGNWTTAMLGTYTVTESATGDIHEIFTDYDDIDQEGIIRVVEGTSDVLTLEVVQTGIGAEVPTVAGGFGSTAIGDINIQTYVRED
ncbi:MAG: hypothetical protein GY835_13450 [bacterium]|nr:hypothetical protein [bacterium]